MELNNFELEIILGSLRRERERAEKDYIEALKKEINKNPYNHEDKVCVGVAESFLFLQRFNNLIIKCEDELRKRI